MDRSELALSIGIRQLASHMDAISHNIANVNSMGYKRRVANFDEVLLEAERANDPASPSLPLPAYREQGDVSQGDLQTTSDPLNIALSGEGYLGVVLPSGELAYTRNGELALGPNGALLTVGGDRVANDQGLPIEIPRGQAFNISRTGDVVDKDSGAIVGTARHLSVRRLGSTSASRELSLRADPRVRARRARPRHDGRTRQPRTQQRRHGARARLDDHRPTALRPSDACNACRRPDQRQPLCSLQ